jgi:hypothetical protein
MNLKGYGKKQPGHNLMYNPGICQRSGRHLNRALPKYMPDALTCLVQAAEFFELITHFKLIPSNIITLNSNHPQSISFGTPRHTYVGHRTVSSPDLVHRRWEDHAAGCVGGFASYLCRHEIFSTCTPINKIKYSICSSLPTYFQCCTEN